MDKISIKIADIFSCEHVCIFLEKKKCLGVQFLGFIVKREGETEFFLRLSKLLSRVAVPFLPFFQQCKSDPVFPPLLQYLGLSLCFLL